VIASPLRPKPRQHFVATQRRRATLTGNDVPGSFAFNGAGVAGVEIRGLVIRDFVPPDLGGYGAIKGGPHWRVIGNRIGPNKNVGLYQEAFSVIRGNLIRRNTVAGIDAFKANGSLVVNNELSYNGKSRAPGRASAAKWAGSIGIVIRGNFFHNNWSNSLWLDGDNLDVVVENNIVTDNFGKGIHYEISCAGVIRGNVIKGNAGPGILVVASRNVRIYRNIVGGNGDGIQVSHQDRTSENGPNDNCPWVTGRVRIHDNKVMMRRGSTGLWTWQVSDGDAIFTDGRVRFFRNHYRVAAGLTRPFLWANGSLTWSQWRSHGQDRDGTFQRP
jgi:parallel beta-helix repeat protein